MEWIKAYSIEKIIKLKKIRKGKDRARDLEKDYVINNKTKINRPKTYKDWTLQRLL